MTHHHITQTLALRPWRNDDRKTTECIGQSPLFIVTEANLKCAIPTGGQALNGAIPYQRQRMTGGDQSVVVTEQILIFGEHCEEFPPIALGHRVRLDVRWPTSLV